MSSLRFVLAVLAVLACAHGADVTQRPTQWPMRSMGAGLFDWIKPLIIGGSNARPAEFPHQVSMQASLMGIVEQHMCGGTIIAPRWILTAAHCVKGVPSYASIVILAGKTNLGRREGGQQRANVRKTFVHELYKRDGQEVGPYDIGLLLLDRPLQYSRTVQPALLPAQGAIPTGSAVLSGWGMDNPFDKNHLPDQLQKLELPVIPFARCNAFIASTMHGGANPLRDTNVCVGYLDRSGKGSCQGDSGGPLVQYENGKPVVIGATSWGFTPCAVSPTPSVYTRVSAYVDWIREKMARNN